MLQESRERIAGVVSLSNEENLDRAAGEWRKGVTVHGPGGEDGNTGRYSDVLDSHQMFPSVPIIYFFQKSRGGNHEPRVKMDREKYWTFEEKTACLSSGP